MLRPAVLSAALCLLGCSGCSLFNHVQLAPIATTFQKPSNVAVYAAVTDHGQPITDLQAESFKIYENEQLIAGDDSHQLLLPQELAAYHHTLLLLDLSGQAGPNEALARAVVGFVETTRKKQSVTVFVFDGDPSLRLVLELAKSSDSAALDWHALGKLGSTDASRNLNGALVNGLKELEARLDAQPKTLRIGTLVVFTRGADLAGRVSAADANRALAETEHDVIAIGPEGSSDRTLSNIGKSFTVGVQGDDGLGVAFENAAQKTRDLFDKYYLLSYCSPARNGMRKLKVEVRFRDREGNDQLGYFSRDFDATGFGPGCNSEAVPRFVLPPKQVDIRAKSEPKAAPPDAGHALPGKPPVSDDDSVAPPPNKPGYSH